MKDDNHAMQAEREKPPRVTGTWVIGGLLLVYVIFAWSVVSLVFLHRA